METEILWEGHRIALSCRTLARHAWATTETEVTLDGTVVARGGGLTIRDRFEIPVDHEGEIRRLAVEIRAASLSLRNVKYRAAVDGVPLSSGRVPVDNWKHPALFWGSVILIGLSYIFWVLFLSDYPAYAEINEIIMEGIEARVAGQDDVAHQRFAEGLSMSQAVGHHRGEAAANLLIGDLHVERKAYSQALPYLSVALPLVRDGGDPTEEALVLSLLGQVHYQLGEFALSADYSRQALSVYESLDYPEESLISFIVLASANIAAGDAESALTALEKGLRQAEAWENDEAIDLYRDLIECAQTYREEPEQEEQMTLCGQSVLNGETQ